MRDEVGRARHLNRTGSCDSEHLDSSIDVAYGVQMICVVPIDLVRRGAGDKTCGSGGGLSSWIEVEDLNAVRAADRKEFAGGGHCLRRRLANFRFGHIDKCAAGGQVAGAGVDGVGRDLVDIGTGIIRDGVNVDREVIGNVGNGLFNVVIANVRRLAGRKRIVLVEIDQATVGLLLKAIESRIGAVTACSIAIFIIGRYCFAQYCLSYLL